MMINFFHYLLFHSLFWSLLTAVPLVSALPPPKVSVFFLCIPSLCSTSEDCNAQMTVDCVYFDIITVEYFICVFFRARQLMPPCFSSLQTPKTGYASQSVRLTSWSSPLPCKILLYVYTCIFFENLNFLPLFFLFYFFLTFVQPECFLENRKLLELYNFMASVLAQVFLLHVSVVHQPLDSPNLLFFSLSCNTMAA